MGQVKYLTTAKTLMGYVRHTPAPLKRGCLRCVSEHYARCRRLRRMSNHEPPIIISAMEVGSGTSAGVYTLD